jgi:hypothetical protein
MADELTTTERNALKWALFKGAYAKIASSPSMSAQDMWFKLKAWLEMMDDG